MKISIIGYSGAGKSTLATKIGEKLNLNILHFDRINFLPNWVPVSKEIRNQRILDFISSHDNWVIDGNYFNAHFEERMEQSDLIIFMNFNRFVCYKNARNRVKEFKNKYRPSAPDGCKERLNPSFRFWILFQGRTLRRKNIYKKTRKKYPGKFITFKSYKEVNDFILNIGKYL